MNNKPTVLVLGKLPPPYMGPAIATEIILNSGLKEEYDLVHLDTRINQSISGIGKWSFAKLFKTISLYKKFKKELTRANIDVVLVPISQTTLGFVKDAVFILLASGTPTKIVVQLRGSNLKNWLSRTSVLVKRFVKKVLGKVDGAIVLGPNLTYLFDGLIDKDKVFVVPNGANFQIPENEQQTFSLPRVLYLANFIEAKGFFDVLKAKKILQEQGADVELIAAGAWMDPAFERKCRSFIETEEIQIDLRKSVSGDEKTALLNSVDVFVFTPNEPEGHPWVLVEATAFSLPIISTDQGAITNNVLDQKNGFIVQPNSPNEIAERLKELKDDNLRKRMGESSRALYEQEFTQDKMVENLSNTFQAVLKG